MEVKVIHVKLGVCFNAQLLLTYPSPPSDRSTEIIILEPYRNYHAMILLYSAAASKE